MSSVIFTVIKNELTYMYTSYYKLRGYIAPINRQTCTSNHA